MNRFGINATGRIVERFVECAAQAEGAAVTAISSRSIERARDAAARFQIPHAYGSYEQMLDSDEIDAVYVATPHNFHYRDCMLALVHGKHVLCEKAMTLSKQEAEGIFALAQQKGLFVMEAMWPRFLPIFARAKQIIESGTIGDLNYLDVSFCFRNSENPRTRILDKSLAGGALYDVGVYCIEMAAFLAGENPDAYDGVTVLSETGVDLNDALSLRFPGGAVATIRCGVEARTDNLMSVYGTKGCLYFSEFPKPASFDVLVGETLIETVTHQEEYNFRGEIEEAVRAIEAHAIESPIMPHSDTIACAALFDHFRDKWGL